MKQEEEQENDIKFNSGDMWLRNNFQEETEEIKPRIKLEQSDIDTSDDELEHLAKEDVKGRNQGTEILKRRKENKKTNKESCLQVAKRHKVNEVTVKNVNVSDKPRTGLCTLSCNDCNFTSTSWDRIRRHTKLKHQKLANVSTFERYLVKATVYVCKICSGKVYCELKQFEQHFLHQHKMSFSEYKVKYESKKNVTENLKELLRNGRLCKDKIGNMCLLQCLKCHAVFRAIHSLRSHGCKSKECMINTRQRLFWLDCLLDVATHVCKICSELLLCDRETILNHVLYHGLKNLDEYAKKTGVTQIYKGDIEYNLTVSTDCKRGKTRDAARNSKYLLKGAEHRNINTGILTDTSSNKSTVPHMLKVEVSDTATPGLCILTCTVCSASHTNWYEFKTHMKNKHNTVIGRRSGFECFLSKATIHICKICSRKIFCEAGLLTGHIIGKHNLTLSEYRKKYNCATDCKVQLQKLLDNGKLSPHIVGNLCTFNCPKCNKIFNGLNTFRHHNSKNSKKCFTQVKVETWTKCLKDVVTHKCKICGKLMLCDAETLKIHVSCHGFKSLSEYAKETKLTYMYKGDIEAQKVEVLANRKALDLMMENATISEKATPGLCILTCPDCSAHHRNIDVFLQHMKIKHDKVIKLRRIDCHRYMTKATAHVCKICLQKVFCEASILSDHFYRVHKISIIDYRKACCDVTVKIDKIQCISNNQDLFCCQQSPLTKNPLYPNPNHLKFTVLANKLESIADTCS